MFENAKWIARERDLSEHNAPYIRKNFELEQEVKRALLNVCGLGYGDYYINGRRINKDVLTTPFTKYDARVLYNEYDITSFLKKGINAVGIILGNGFYNNICGWGFADATWRHAPKLILEIDIELADGEKKKILSDTSFKTAESPIVYNHARCGEIYDARQEISGWSNAGFDDSKWDRALITSSPGGIIEKNTMPPINKIEYIQPEECRNGVYDFGKNISGFASIRVKGKRGEKVRLIYSDRLTPDGKADTFCVNRFNTAEVKHTDTYILSGEKEEEWEPRFVYHGFRYVELQTEAEVISITAVRVHTDLSAVGDFECSSDIINKIHMASVMSTLTNFHGIPTDCPHREQNGWTGDAQISSEQAIMNFDMTAVYKKWMNDFKDAQRKSGQLPGIIPNPAGWGYTSGGPAWDSAIILIPYYIYHLTGDISVAEDMWENMERYMSYLESQSENYLFEDYYSLWDWCTPPGANVCPKQITDAAYYHSDCVKMAIMSEKLNKNPQKYIETAKNIKEAFRKRFIKNGIVEGDSQTAVACAIGEGFYNEDEIPAAAAHLAELVREKDYHTDCGIIGIKYSFNALSEYGYSDVVYKMITNPTMPSYAYWINSGMTTLCEDWEMKNCCGEDSSLNHHMFSEVDMWFYKYLAGIQLSENGTLIKPCFIDEIGWVRARHRGIEVYWDKEQLKLKTDRSVTVCLSGQKQSVGAGEYTFSLKNYE